MFRWMLLFVGVHASPRLSTWLVHGKIPWNECTHLRYGAPIVFPDGHVKCNQTQMSSLTSTAHAHNVSVLWSPGIPTSDYIEHHTPDLNWDTIRQAVDDCHVDGIEVGSIAITTRDVGNHYSAWLAKLRRTIRKPVSATLHREHIRWINVTMLNRGDIDWVNTMSYHYSAIGDVWAWKKDLWDFLNVWGLDPARINLGVPLFGKQWVDKRLVGTPTWNELSVTCPKVSLDTNVCKGVTFVGKQMMIKIGHMVRKHKIGGFFVAPLDSQTDPLIPFLWKGWGAIPSSNA